MSQTSIIDDVFIGKEKISRKFTPREILGSQIQSNKNQREIYSNKFIPFVSERNIKGKIIKDQPQKFRTEKVLKLFKSKLQKADDRKDHDMKRDSLIDLRFKFNQVSHFRNVDLSPHLEKLPEFIKGLQSLQNKDYQRKRQAISEKEEFYLTSFHKNTKQNKDLSNDDKEQINPRKRIQSLKNLKQKLVVGKQIKNKGQREYFESEKEKRAKSMKNLINSHRHHNPELQQIERQVKVHFNHPELEKLKQSRKLTLKFLENIQKGDKKFKQKVEEYRNIKERIKKQMAKI